GSPTPREVAHGRRLDRPRAASPSLSDPGREAPAPRSPGAAPVAAPPPAVNRRRAELPVPSCRGGPEPACFALGGDPFPARRPWMRGRGRPGRGIGDGGKTCL